MPGHQPGPPRAVLGHPRREVKSLQDQEVDGADGERVWEAAVGREGFLEGNGGGHKKPQ